MALQDILLLKLERTETNGDIKLTDREQPNAIDGVAHSLFQQAKQALDRHSSKQFGFFSNDSEHQKITGLINNWQSAGINFTGLARRLAQLLQQQLQVTEDPFSAMVLTAHEQLLGQHYCYLFWLTEQEVIQAGNDLEPYTGKIIIADRPQYGLRLHLDGWQNGDSPKYLTYLATRGNKAFTEAFERFCNFRQGIDTGQQTAEFLAIVDSFSEQLPEEKAGEVKASILDYCVAQDKIGQPVSVPELSQHINEKQPQHFAGFVQQQQTTSLDEIHTDRQSLKRYMRYFGRDHSLSISFSAERMGKDIVYNAAEGILHIHSPPKSLKSQLRDLHQKNEKKPE